MKLSKAVTSPARLGVGALLMSMAVTTATPTVAQDAPKSQSVAERGIEDIVVIARRRQENLQSVPIAITALSPKRMEQLNITRDADVYKNVPGVGSHSNFTGSTYVAIRGQDGKGAVVPYQNEVPHVSQGINDPYGPGVGGPAMFYDMENVQILKGPQGTLFGRNTTGGAILYQTRRPGDQFGGSISLTYGNYNNKEVTAALNVPVLEDKVLLRVAGTYVNRDGYTHVLATPSHPNGLDVQDKNAYSVRTTLTLKPSDTVQNDMIVQFMHTKDTNTASIIDAIDPNFAGGFIGVLFPQLAAQVAQQAALGKRTQIPIGVDPEFHAHYWNATNITKFEVSDNLTIRNIASYQQYKIINWAVDGDGTLSTLCDCLGRFEKPQINTMYTEELQFQGKSFDNKLSWTVGGFLLSAPPSADYNVQWNKFFSTGGVTYNDYRDGSNSKALYAQGTYDMSSMLEGLKFTAGFRYTWDHIYNSVRKNVPATAAGVRTCPAGRPNADALCTQTREASFTAPTWTVGFDYQFSPRSLAYVVSRRGYRQGGVNPGSNTSVYGVFKPEHVTDLEVGIKSDWDIGDAKVRTNLSAFRQWYKDIQAESLEPSVANTITFVFRNGPSAVVQGFEFEGVVQPVESIELSGHVAYLDQEYTYSGLTFAESATIRNAILQNKPRWKYALNASYHLPIEESMGDLSVSVNWTFESTQGLVKSAADHPYDLQKGYGLLNLSVDWDRVMGSTFSGQFYMNNVTDKLYAVGSYALRPALGFAGRTWGEPRMFGARIKYKFGGEAD